MYTRCMVRTQIFLTEKESHFLDLMAKRQRTSRSEIIRNALDAKLGIAQTERVLEAARAAFGCLKGRSLKKHIRRLRAQW